MAIRTSVMGSVTVSGDDAKSFLRRIANSRGTKAAAESVRTGRKLVSEFTKNGAVTITLKAVKVSAKQK